MLTVKIEKLVFGGQGLGRVDNKVVFAWNALPNETVEVNLIRNKKDFAEGNAETILTASPHRLPAREEHFLSCSPWQVLDFDQENYWKRAMALETYQQIGKFTLQPTGINPGVNPDTTNPRLQAGGLASLDIVSDSAAQYGYRNKIEFSFFGNDDDTISLAFFKRGQRYRQPIPGCELAEPCINETAQTILAWVNQQHIPLRSLKTLIVRSNGAGKTIAALFIKDKLEFPDYPPLNEMMLGFHVYYSTHKSPMSVPTELLYTSGQNYLTAQLRSATLKFGLLGFFQINIALFTQALNDIAQFLDKTSPLLDYYSGVGAISIPLAEFCTSCTLIDNNAEAIEYAQANIVANHLENFEAKLIPAEKMTELITAEHTVILDPPRAGLHQNVIDRLLAVQPKRIIYMSCNLATHARDVQLLLEKYTITFSRLYNFFPRTPHIEGLIVLDRIR